MQAKPIISLITSHGVKIDHVPSQKSDDRKPWVLKATSKPLQRITGLIQRLKPEDHPDLPEGSMTAVLVLLIEKHHQKPEPGDELLVEGQPWRIKTILPLLSNRTKSIVEALVTSSGEIRDGG